MAHMHNIYDTDKHFTIDPVTRVISTEVEKLVLIVNDHNSERYTFEIPRMIEGHDMSQCNKVEIHYDNISKDKKTVNSDYYTVDDLSISEEDDSVVIFSWLISDAATQLVGKLRFSIHFECYDDDGTRVYGRNTTYFEKVTISDGVSNTEKLLVQHSDFVERMELLGSKANEALAEMENKENKPYVIECELGDTIDYVTYTVKCAKTYSEIHKLYNSHNGNIRMSVKFGLSSIQENLVFSPKMEAGGAIIFYSGPSAIANLYFGSPNASIWLLPDGSDGSDGNDANSSSYVMIYLNTFPNPTTLTFTGAVTGTYDGSRALTVNIPEAGISETAVDNKVSSHNTSKDSHNDLRLLIEGLSTRLNALADSDDTTLDQMSEIVAYIKNNKSLIDSVTTGKVSVTDIIDNLTTNISNKPLSAAQGVVLNNLISEIKETFTDDHVNSLIDEKLGVIENGAY